MGGYGGGGGGGGLWGLGGGFGFPIQFPSNLFDASGQLDRALLLRRVASGYANLAYLYRAFGIAFLWGRYHQILGPRRHFP